MPRITYLKTIDGALWAKLDLDMATTEGPVHILTDREIKEIKDRERKAVWDEIQEACNRYNDYED